MQQFDYQYMIHSKQQQLSDEIWDVEERPTTSQRQAESNSVSCNVCKRNFSSEKALWGHRRCCKAAKAEDRNQIGSVSSCKADVLQSSWLRTAKRGRKPVLDITSPEFVGASILMDMSRSKNGEATSSHEREKKKAEIEESQPFGDSAMAKIECGKSFVCVICGRAFPSPQALGGHRASHGKYGVMVSSAKDEEEVKHSKGLISGDHRCEICGASYLSGQALGGHKRKHWMGAPFSPVSRSKASEDQAST